MKLTISILFLSLITALTFAQNNAFKANEKLTYTGSYKMAGLMTDFAQINMQTSEVKSKNSTLLRLKCTATSFAKWDNIFKIRDLYESYVNPKSIAPYLYKRDIDENGYYKFVKYIFSYKNKTVKSLIRKKTKNTKSGFWDQNNTLKVTPGTRDIVSTIYKIRTLDIKKAKIGDSDTFIVLFDNEETKLTFKLLAKETINTAIGSKECYKLGINVIGNDVLKGNNTNLLWLTADENKIPVYAKFKVAFGTGELKIKTATGLKN